MIEGKLKNSRRLAGGAVRLKAPNENVRRGPSHQEALAPVFGQSLLKNSRQMSRSQGKTEDTRILFDQTISISVSTPGF